MGKSKNIEIGQRFGQLTVLSELKPVKLPSGQTNRVFLMRCDCGKEKSIRLLHFIRGRIVTCGHVRHGDTGKSLHNSWRAMRNRCRENYFQSRYYGDRNISVYPEWNKYEVFRKWATDNGYVDGMTIDRIDNSRGYYPDNCRFVSQSENNLNKRNTFLVAYNGTEIPLLSLLINQNKSEHYNAILRRIKRGWDHSRAIDTPIRIGNYRRNK